MISRRNRTHYAVIGLHTHEKGYHDGIILEIDGKRIVLESTNRNNHCDWNSATLLRRSGCHRLPTKRELEVICENIGEINELFQKDRDLSVYPKELWCEPMNGYFWSSELADESENSAFVLDTYQHQIDWRQVYNQIHVRDVYDLVEET